MWREPFHSTIPQQPALSVVRPATWTHWCCTIDSLWRVPTHLEKVMLARFVDRCTSSFSCMLIGFDAYCCECCALIDFNNVKLGLLSLTVFCEIKTSKWNHAGNSLWSLFEDPIQNKLQHVFHISNLTFVLAVALAWLSARDLGLITAS